MIKELILIFGAIFLMTSHIQAAEYRGQKSFDIKKALDEIKTREGAIVSEESGLWRVDIQKEASVYFFTKKDHFAYPSMVIRKIIEEENSIDIRTTGYTAADKKIFEGWLAEFQEQDKIIIQSLQQQ
ncbi:MAG: hypothetical protein AB8B81_17895 [Halioglobus sp.]